jgi:uncharacterized protein YdeI (YjbR/CyaY-like superfamily)
VPDVQEGLKWSTPAFEHKGILCGMSAFKEYVTLGFWKHQLLIDRGLLPADSHPASAMGRIASLEDLPSDKELTTIIKAAAALNDQGVKVVRPAKPKRPPVKVPGYFAAALRKNKKAAETFEKSSPSHRREYVEWITEAKGEDTRARRIETALAWLAEGKSRNWKYERSSRRGNA